MAEPIIEQIAQWLVAALEEITVAGGYQQTLSVVRPEELYIDSDTVGDLTALCEMGDCDEDMPPTMDQVFWRQTFHTWVYVLGAAGTSLAVDTRVARVIADVHKRLGGEQTCGGLAYRLDLLPWSLGISAEKAATVIDIPAGIAFAVARDDPYSNT